MLFDALPIPLSCVDETWKQDFLWKYASEDLKINKQKISGWKFFKYLIQSLKDVWYTIGLPRKYRILYADLRKLAYTERPVNCFITVVIMMMMLSLLLPSLHLQTLPGLSLKDLTKW